MLQINGAEAQRQGEDNGRLEKEERNDTFH